MLVLVGGGGGGCHGMLLLHPLPTCTDTCPDLCTFYSDLCTLSLWCYPSINQRKYSTCTHGGGTGCPWGCAGGVFPSAIGASSPCTGGGVTHCNLRWWSFSFHSLAHILCLRSGNLHCVVVVCGGGIYFIICLCYIILYYII